MFLLADPSGQWTPSDGLASALQAVSGVPPECAELKPITRVFPKLTRWVYSEQAAAAAAAEAATVSHHLHPSENGGSSSALTARSYSRQSRRGSTDADQQKQALRRGSASARGAGGEATRLVGKGGLAGGGPVVGGGLSAACPVTEPSADALRMSVPPKLRGFFLPRGGGGKSSHGGRDGGGSPNSPPAAATTDAATRFWCTLLCLAWLEEHDDTHFLASEPRSLDDAGVMLSDCARRAVERAIAEEAPALRPHIEGFYESALRQARGARSGHATRRFGRHHLLGVAVCCW